MGMYTKNTVYIVLLFSIKRTCTTLFAEFLNRFFFLLFRVSKKLQCWSKEEWKKLRKQEIRRGRFIVVMRQTWSKGKRGNFWKVRMSEIWIRKKKCLNKKLLLDRENEFKVKICFFLNFKILIELLVVHC